MTYARREYRCYCKAHRRGDEEAGGNADPLGVVAISPRADDDSSPMLVEDSVALGAVFCIQSGKTMNCLMDGLINRASNGQFRVKDW